MAQKSGVALLVGAGDAIGAAVARRFATGGYKVCIARRDPTKSQTLVDELNAAGADTPRGRGTILFTGATASVRGGRGFAAFSSAKVGLRAVAQAMARELGPKNIHVVHLLIDAGVDSEEIHRRYKAQKGVDAADIPPDSLTRTSSIADAYWFAHHQSRDGWTHELDLRPAIEKW